MKLIIGIEVEKLKYSEVEKSKVEKLKSREVEKSRR